MLHSGAPCHQTTCGNGVTRRVRVDGLGLHGQVDGKMNEMRWRECMGQARHLATDTRSPISPCVTAFWVLTSAPFSSNSRKTPVLSAWTARDTAYWSAMSPTCISRGRARRRGETSHSPHLHTHHPMQESIHKGKGYGECEFEIVGRVNYMGAGALGN